MYMQVLKEILLTTDFEQEHINKFLSYCREQFSGNTTQLTNVDKFEKEYWRDRPIWWYSNCFFPYSMVNRAFRTMETDLTIKLGFFIQDLHQQIDGLHSKEYDQHYHRDSFIVCRGQGLSQIDFDRLVQTKGELISLNNFLLTSLDQKISLAYAKSNPGDPQPIGVLFKITIDPSMSSTPFAPIRDINTYQMEGDILFSMHSVFRVGQIQRIDEANSLWEVDLTLISENDPQLQVLTESMRKETFSNANGWDRLGLLLIKLGYLNKAKILYEILLQQTSETDDKEHLFHQLVTVKYKHGEYEKAAVFYEKALVIREKTLPSNHLDLVSAHNNIGLVYEHVEKYSKALSCYKKTLQIFLKALPSDRSDLATSYNSIGSVYNNTGEHSKAVLYYKKALQIWEKALSSDHPDLATSYNNIGLTYSNMREYSQALPYCEKALRIWRKILPSNHPDLAISYNNIGSVYDNMGNYSKSFTYYEKPLQISLETLPLNHPDLATSYNNNGSVYDSMGEYSKALLYYEKALKVFVTVPASNQDDLATSYNNISSMYSKMGEYLKALWYHEKAFHI